MSEASKHLEGDLGKCFTHIGPAPVKQFIDLFNNMFNHLTIGFQDESKLGQITLYGHDTYFNLFDYEKSIDVYLSAMDELVDFSNSEPIKRDSYRRYLLREQGFSYVVDELLNDRSPYSMFLGDISISLFYELWLANKEINASPKGFSKRAASSYSDKPSFICSPEFDLFSLDKLEKLESDNKYCLEVIDKFLVSLDRAIEKDSSRKRSLEESKRKLTELSSQLSGPSTKVTFE
ncbi:MULTISPECIES: hypothetical protein [unclassified Vibrio]|uniref:hypothetical protein n=1 Tax=unclassified Vibrio TaxID=2614977 RepID=UPI003552C99C